MEVKFGFGKIGVGNKMKKDGTGVLCVGALEDMAEIGAKLPKDVKGETLCEMSFANLNSLKVVINSLRRLESKMKKGT